MSRYSAAATLLAVLTLPAAFAQDPSPATDPLGGAKSPTPQLQLKREEQYKRVHQLALRYELLGRRDDARRFATDYLARHPEDAETHFLLGVIAARSDDFATAKAEFARAVDLGLPAGRLIVGRKALLGAYVAQLDSGGTSSSKPQCPSTDRCWGT